MNYDPMKPDRVLLAVEEASALQRREVELWKEWIADKHRTGQHGYEAFLPRTGGEVRPDAGAGAPGALQAARLQRRDHLLRCVRFSAERLRVD